MEPFSPPRTLVRATASKRQRQHSSVESQSFDLTGIRDAIRSQMNAQGVDTREQVVPVDVIVGAAVPSYLLGGFYGM